MKNYGIWNEMHAVYPFVGGTAETNKWNLKDTGSFIITASGNWNYSSNGVSSSNVNNDYLNTDFFVTTSNDLSLGIYSRTESSASGYDMGSTTPQSGGEQLGLIAKYPNGEFYWGIPTQIGGVTTPVTSSLGFFQASRVSDTNLVGWVNEYATGSNTNGATPKDYRALWIGNINNVIGQQDPSDRQYAYAYIGKGLSAQQLSDYNTLVQQFQQSLSRKV
jgi:hypothetical protein